MPSWSDCSTFAGDIVKAKAGAQSVTNLLEIKPQIDSWSKEGRHAVLEQGHVQFENVHFRYPTRYISKSPSINDVDQRSPSFEGWGLILEIKPGQFIALVGPSSCGKTTCVSLLECIYDSLIGQITVDGIGISDYNLSDYRKCVSFVSQEPTYANSPFLRWLWKSYFWIASHQIRLSLVNPSATKNEVTNFKVFGGLDGYSDLLV